ncbi:hypothetical protein [Morganella morganii]|uniref:hypothetical protein n=1 Tax=Morganella morganii TaxID=582 RepID=UPI001881C52C|nr:hypothetical protein [Morganella morganii]
MSRPIDLIADITDEYIAKHFEGTNYGHTNFGTSLVKDACMLWPDITTDIPRSAY